MPKDFINDPTHWRNRAAETRELAKRVHDKEAQKGCPTSRRNSTASLCA